MKLLAWMGRNNIQILLGHISFTSRKTTTEQTKLLCQTSSTGSYLSKPQTSYFSLTYKSIMIQTVDEVGRKNEYPFLIFLFFLFGISLTKFRRKKKEERMSQVNGFKILGVHCMSKQKREIIVSKY